MVIWSKLRLMLALRSTRVAGCTAETTPRTSEPAGTTVRPSMSRSATVVPSKRSSTTAVPEFRPLVSRMSNSVPTGISTPPRAVVRVPLCGARPPSRLPSPGAALLPARFALPVLLFEYCGDVACARVRTFSIRSRTSANSLRLRVRSLRSFTLR
jgi:hypothetical protein